MRASGLSIVGALVLLAACGSEPPAPATSEQTEPTQTREIAGPKVQILAFGDSLFAGYGLASPEQSYPAQLEQALRQDGHNVQIANAGVSGDTTAAGLQRLAFTLDSQPTKPDLILLDLNLPKMDGREVLASIKRDQRLKIIPTIILTTSDNEADVVISYQLRANCYLRKPAHWDAFDNLVRSINAFWLTMAKLPQQIPNAGG